jgi:hypothetical protein
MEPSDADVTTLQLDAPVVVVDLAGSRGGVATAAVVGTRCCAREDGVFQDEVAIATIGIVTTSIFQPVLARFFLQNKLMARIRLYVFKRSQAVSIILRRVLVLDKVSLLTRIDGLGDNVW